MQEVDSVWSRFLVVPFVACLCYGLSGIFCHAPLQVEALLIAAAIMAGYASVTANNWPTSRPLYPIDWLVAPIVGYFVTLVFAVALDASKWWMLGIVPLLFAGYCAGDAKFGRKIMRFIAVDLVNVLLLPFMFIALFGLLCHVATDYFVENKVKIIFRTQVILTITSTLLMVAGWFAGEVKLVAIGLGYSLGLTCASDPASSVFIRTALVISSAISVLALAWRVHEIESVVPMYAVVAGLIALTLTKLENPSGKEVAR